MSRAGACVGVRVALQLPGGIAPRERFVRRRFHRGRGLRQPPARRGRVGARRFARRRPVLRRWRVRRRRGRRRSRAAAVDSAAPHVADRGRRPSVDHHRRRDATRRTAEEGWPGNALRPGVDAEHSGGAGGVFADVGERAHDAADDQPRRDCGDRGGGRQGARGGNEDGRPLQRLDGRQSLVPMERSAHDVGGRRGGHAAHPVVPRRPLRRGALQRRRQQRARAPERHHDPRVDLRREVQLHLDPGGPDDSLDRRDNSDHGTELRILRALECRRADANDELLVERDRHRNRAQPHRLAQPRSQPGRRADGAPVLPNARATAPHAGSAAQGRHRGIRSPDDGAYRHTRELRGRPRNDGQVLGGVRAGRCRLWFDGRLHEPGAAREHAASRRPRQSDPERRVPDDGVVQGDDRRPRLRQPLGYARLSGVRRRGVVGRDRQGPHGPRRRRGQRRRRSRRRAGVTRIRIQRTRARRRHRLGQRPERSGDPGSTREATPRALRSTSSTRR